MKRFPAACALLFLLSLSFVSARAEEDSSDALQTQQVVSAISPAWLQKQVREIARSHELSHAKKEKRISNLVRVAVNAGTAYRSGHSSLILSRAIAYATAAAQAAPQFSKIIINAVSFAPAVARIEGASGQVEAAVDATALTRRPRPHASASLAARSSYYTPAPRVKKSRVLPPDNLDPSDVASDSDDQASEPLPVAPRKKRARPVVSDAEPLIAEAEPTNPSIAANPPPDSTALDEESSYPPSQHHWTAPQIGLGENASLHLKATVSAKYDNNIFLSPEKPVSDEVYTVAPGIDFKFGQVSQAHGSVSLEESFLRYGQSKAPGAQLASDTADLGFGNDNLKFSANASYQQLYQNNSDIVTLGQRTIYHSSILTANSDVEASVASKMSVGVGLDYYGTTYKGQGLYNSRDISIPVKLYYSVTPKSDLFSGVTYSSNTVNGASDSAKDLYYNIGARGEFTPKFNGQISVGYKTRSFGGTTNDGTFGFDGNLNYELTPKTVAALAVSRGYSTSALGESLTNTRYTLSLSTQFSPQWQGGLSVSHYDNDYGVTFFNPLIPIGVERRDQYWEGNLMGTYLYTTWLSVSAGLTLRNNHSTLSAAEFSNDLFSLILGLRY